MLEGHAAEGEKAIYVVFDSFGHAVVELQVPWPAHGRDKACSATTFENAMGCPMY